jgi:hypothetical protein
LSEQSNSSVTGGQLRKYGIAGLAVHLAGFALGVLSIASVLSGAIDFESGIAVLTPFADMLYGLGLVIAVAVAARTGVPIKYMVVAGAVIGVGLFYKSAPHEFHIAAGMGFGLPHNGHVIIGTILITVSVTAIAAMSLLFLRRHRTADLGNKVT